MKSILIVSRILSKYRSNFRDGGIDLTLNEALILEVVKNNVNTKKQISNTLLKDNAYVIRAVNKMVMKGLIEEEKRVLKLTEKGVERWRRCSEICGEINKEWMAQESLYDRSLDEEMRKTFIKLFEGLEG